MATPLPQSPLTLPAYNENRGVNFFDTLTKSTRQVPIVYTKKDTCGRNAYRSIGVALSINQLLNGETNQAPGCDIVLAASGSLNLLLPISASVADMTTVTSELIRVVTAVLAPDPG